MFVAATSGGQVLGVVGATPKKGHPIKLMPLVAVSPQAFSALVADIPQHLKDYGHKLYTHIVPTVDEVLVLQRFGWSLDCMLPAAYHDSFVTQQWSYTFGETYMRMMRVKNRFFQSIKRGEKDLEVRVGYGNIQKIQAGELVRLATQNDSMVIRVKDVRMYETFARMLQVEDAGRIAPGMNGEELLHLLQTLYPQAKESLGVYVLEVQPQDNATRDTKPK